MSTQPDSRDPGIVRWTVATALATIAVILLVFVTQMLVSLRSEVGDLKGQLATKRELANLAVHLGPPDPALAGLEETCTDCHSKETFETVHGITADVHDLVTRMSQLSGAHITPDQVPRVEAALTFMKCAHCHTMDRLKELAILEPQQRWDVIIAMMREPGARITPEDAKRIRDFYGSFWGWHSR